MQRRNFLFTSLLALPATLLPKFSFTANSKSNSRPKEGLFIRANESRFDGEQKTMTTDLLRCVISNKDTDGQLLMGTTMPPLKFKGGPPLHVHEHQEEIFFVVAGEFLIQLGEEVFLAKAGDAAFVPRGVAHTFANPYEDNPGSLMSVHFPGSIEMEGYFKSIAKGKFPKKRMPTLKMPGHRLMLKRP